MTALPACEWDARRPRRRSVSRGTVAAAGPGGDRPQPSADRPRARRRRLCADGPGRPWPGEPVALSARQLDRIRDLYEAVVGPVPARAHPGRARGRRGRPQAGPGGRWCTGMGLDDDLLDTPGYDPQCAWRPATGTGVATDDPLRLERRVMTALDTRGFCAQDLREYGRTAAPSYVFHLDGGLADTSHAKHYTGHADPGQLADRWARHGTSEGARILEVQRERGGTWHPVATFPGTRDTDAPSRTPATSPGTARTAPRSPTRNPADSAAPGQENATRPPGPRPAVPLPAGCRSAAR